MSNTLKKHDNRRIDVELLRIISAFGVVWFHVVGLPGRDVAYAGLVVFLVFSAFFAVSSSKAHSLWSRVRRLLVPCLIWSVVYALLRVARDLPVFEPSAGWAGRLLATPSIHLWYLPFIFIAIILIDRLKGWVPKREFGIAAGVLCALMLAASPWWRQHPLGIPWAQYIHAWPAVCFGVFLGCHRALSTRKRLLILLLVAAALGYTFMHDLGRVSVSYAVGLSVACVLLLPKSLITRGRWVRTLADAMLGVYIIHVAVLLVLYKLGITGVVAVVSAFAISTAVVLIAQRVLPKRVVTILF